MTREHAALAVSAPLMVAGLVTAALAGAWNVRLGGSAMVIGGALALAVTDMTHRWLAWGLAFIGLVAVILALI
jgi:hypothetical protein